MEYRSPGRNRASGSDVKGGMTALGRRGIAITAGLLVGAASLTGCTKDRGFVDPDVPVGSFGLVAFDSCQQALDGLRKAAKAVVGPYGFGGDYALEDSAGAARSGAEAAPAPAMADSTAKSTAETPTYSGTNTHESGVDEPDLVKTDGRRIVTIANGRLRVIDAASRRVTGMVDLDDGAGNYVAGDLLLAGDHALVLADQGYAYKGPVIDIAPARPSTSEPADAILGPNLLLVDLARAKVLSRAKVDGSLVDARQVGSVARVVVRSTPRLEFPNSENTSPEQRTTANQAAIDAAAIEAWTPRVDVTTGGTTTRSQVGCDAISRPASYSGTNLLTVLTFDIADSALTDGTPVSIVADGDTVYSNGPSLYVASNQAWRALPVDSGSTQVPEPTTEIYKFSTSTKERPRFIAGGSVPGRLINQYAMSEWDGKLRVATTTDPVVFADGGRLTSHSGVYVLGEDDGTLKNIGAVDGLGKGERIYSVRFVGTIGYVVTFRQTDPLYTVDLGDPAHPTVKGELKIPGYSAYLHPADGNRLIGVGQDATDQGRVTGTQVSLFDVHDLANPARMAQFKLAGTYSEAEFEPHAFLYWPADGLLVLPLQGRGAGNDPSTTSSRIGQVQGALVLRVSGSAIGEVGFLSHPSYSAIRRSLIIDSTLWTVSDAGLLASDKNSLARLAWIAF